MLNLTKTHGFYPILTQTYSESNSNDHLHTELVQTNLEKSKNLKIFVTGWPIMTKFGTMIHLGTLDPVSQ